MDEETLSADQQAAFDHIMASVRQAEHVGRTGNSPHDLPESKKAKKFYLGGEPGCGKTFLVNRLIQEVGRSRCAVVSPTAIAAQLIGGTTVHSFFGFNFNRLFDNLGRPVHASDRVTRYMDDSKLFFCDEVSMLSAGYFKLVLYLTQEFNVTMVFIGDFMQLPPIPDYKYGKDFQQKAYECEWWQDLQPLILKTNFRQSASDPGLLQALADMRCGQYTQAVYDLLVDRHKDWHPPFATKIFSHRKAVEAENSSRLQELGAPIETFEARIADSVVPPQTAEKMLRGARIPKSIDLAVGARVVMLTNDKDKRWCNGTTGEVARIEHGQVTVQTDAGHMFTTSQSKQEICDANGTVIVSYMQLPLMLAFAMTVHRIQGQTMEHISVDLSNHFETGMTYVAISRCKSRDGLFLTGQFVPEKNLMVDRAAVQMFDSLPAASELEPAPEVLEPEEELPDLPF